MAAGAAEIDERPHAGYPIAVCFGFEKVCGGNGFEKVCRGNDILTARNTPG